MPQNKLQNINETHKNLLVLPDQDILSSLYGTKILALDPFRYNMTERIFLQHAPFEKDLTLNWVESKFCHNPLLWREQALEKQLPWAIEYFL